MSVSDEREKRRGDKKMRRLCVVLNGVEWCEFVEC